MLLAANGPWNNSKGHLLFAGGAQCAKYLPRGAKYSAPWANYRPMRSDRNSVFDQCCDALLCFACFRLLYSPLRALMVRLPSINTRHEG